MAYRQQCHPRVLQEEVRQDQGLQVLRGLRQTGLRRLRHLGQEGRCRPTFHQRRSVCDRRLLDHLRVDRRVRKSTLVNPIDGSPIDLKDHTCYNKGRSHSHTCDNLHCCTTWTHTEGSFGCTPCHTCPR